MFLVKRVGTLLDSDALCHCQWHFRKCSLTRDGDFSSGLGGRVAPHFLQNNACELQFCLLCLKAYGTLLLKLSMPRTVHD